MADPPVSDPQIAALLEQNSKRRQRAILIFVTVALVLGVGLGGSALYSSKQAKKRRNAAYSHVVKCLFGKPLDAGEAPMTRVRSAWRARILAPPKEGAKAADSFDEQDAEKAKMWPNRCVAEMIAFTDTLKDIGEMKEGEKDLGFYSRDLSKQTAGDNWKNVDTYQASVEAFVNEAQKGNFEFIDVPDVQAPELLEAESIDAVFPKSSALETAHIDARTHEMIVSQSAHFFVPAGKGKPARICVTEDGKTLACKAAVAAGLPPQASGVPWMLGSDDGAPSLMAFGRRGGIVDGTSLSVGVFRSGDGLGLIDADKFFVAGGTSRADASAALLLKDGEEPDGDKFKIARLAANATKVQIDPIALTDWNGRAESVALLGSQIVWVTSKDELHARSIDAKDSPIVNVATLPGPLVNNRFNANGEAPFESCRTKSAMFIAVRVRADELERLVVVRSTDAGFGKAQVVDTGTFACGDDAAYVLADQSVFTCDGDACKSATLEKPVAPSRAAVIDGVVVRVEVRQGLLRVAWEKDGKSIATKIYDAQIKGMVLLGESKLGQVRVATRRGYGLVVAEVGDIEHVARVDAKAITPTVVKEE